MDQSEREDSSTYTNNRPRQTEPITERPVEPSHPAEPARKKGRAAAVLAVLLILALIAAGVLGWLWYQETANARSAQDNLANAKREVAQLKKAASEAEGEEGSSETKTSVDAATTDSEKILAAALARAKLDYGGSGAQAQLGKQVGEYASVDVTAKTGGVTLYLKKVDDLWLVISGNQGKPSQEEIDRYDIPQELLAE